MLCAIVEPVAAVTSDCSCSCFWDAGFLAASLQWPVLGYSLQTHFMSGKFVLAVSRQIIPMFVLARKSRIIKAVLFSGTKTHLAADAEETCSDELQKKRLVTHFRLCQEHSQNWMAFTWGCSERETPKPAKKQGRKPSGSTR